MAAPLPPHEPPLRPAPAVTPVAVRVAYDQRLSALPRLGLIALATDLTSEGDAARLVSPDRAALHVARIANVNPTTPDNLRQMAPRLATTADLLVPGVPLAAIYYSCTSASVAIGDAAIAATIHGVRPGVPVVTPTTAAVAAFGALNVRRIALLTPYLPETTAPMAAYFVERGFEVVAACCLGLADDRDMARLCADTVAAAAVAADRPDAEALFLSCTALPALGVIAALEDRLGKPVVSSNQAGFWRLLHHARVAPSPGAPGRLFAAAPKDRAA